MKAAPLTRGRGVGRGVIAAVLPWALAATVSAATPAPALPVADEIRGLPFFPQETNGCGPAVLASVLSFWGVPVELGSLTAEVYSAALKGTLPLDLERAARRRGFTAAVRAGTLDTVRAEIAQGRPVIAFLNLGTRLFPRGHFIVIAGYDDQRRELRVHSGLHPYSRMTYEAFLASWVMTENWQMIAWPEQDPVQP